MIYFAVACIMFVHLKQILCDEFLHMWYVYEYVT